MKRKAILLGMAVAVALACVAIAAAPADDVGGVGGRAFLIEGAPSAQLKTAVLAAARRAHSELQAQWPAPLPAEPLTMRWLDTPADFERETGWRGAAVLALADKRRDMVLLNGPALRRAGAGQIAQTLRHELVHINLARAGIDRLPRWLEEGLAMRLSGEWRWDDEWLTAADRLFGGVEIADALWGAWPDNPDFQQRAYRQAQSLTTFFLREYFPDGGAEALLLDLLRRPGEPAWVGELWRPAARETLWLRWRNQGGRLGAWLQLLTAPTVLLGGVGVTLLIAGYLVRRRRARGVQRQWEEEGPYFGEAPDEDEKEGEEEEEEEPTWEPEEDDERWSS